jgi:hypothetical protein
VHWNVIDVKKLSPLSIQVTFADGTSGKVQFEPSYLTGVFEALKDPDVFRQVYIEQGAVTWPGNLDLAPDAMYEAIKINGEWILD